MPTVYTCENHLVSRQNVLLLMRSRIIFKVTVAVAWYVYISLTAVQSQVTGTFNIPCEKEEK